MKIIIALSLILIILGIIENLNHKKRLDNIPIRILVNGSRGKSTTTSLLVEVFNTYGIKTIGRTSGSETRIINNNNVIKDPNRKKFPRITEMIPFVKYAYEKNAQCIVVECMALRSENQMMMRDKLIKPTHCLITNSYVDHIVEIGKNKIQTANTLSKSVSKDSEVFVNDKYYTTLLKNNIHVSDIEKTREIIQYSDDGLTFIDNIAICREVCLFFDIPITYLESAIKNIPKDIGMYRNLNLKGKSSFLSLFSVNDTESLNLNLKKESLKNYKNIYFIYNNRDSREYRIRMFSKYLNEKYKKSMIYIIGDNKNKVKRYFRNNTSLTVLNESDILKLKDLMDRDDDNSLYVGIGNIKGSGEFLVSKILNLGE